MNDDELRLKCLKMARSDVKQEEVLLGKRALDEVIQRAQLYWSFCHGQSALRRTYQYYFNDSQYNLKNRVSFIYAESPTK